MQRKYLRAVPFSMHFQSVFFSAWKRDATEGRPLPPNPTRPPTGSTVDVYGLYLEHFYKTLKNWRTPFLCIFSLCLDQEI